MSRTSPGGVHGAKPPKGEHIFALTAADIKLLLQVSFILFLLMGLNKGKKDLQSILNGEI